MAEKSESNEVKRKVVIRAAGTADCQAIGRLARQLLQFEHALHSEMGEQTPWAGSEAEIQKQMAQPATKFFIAERNGEVVGYVKAIVHRAGTGGTGWRGGLRAAARQLVDAITRRPRPNVSAIGGLIPGIFVVESERNTGTGGRLLATAENWLRGEGMTSSSIHVLQANIVALRFWEEQGYEPIVIGLRKRLDRD
ncbi:MAG: GNAT family N-acetyltransferase [Blastocatellia bacterium]